MNTLTTIKTHGIIYSTPMVLALLADRKGETRRLNRKWLRVRKGDILIGRETWAPFLRGDGDNGYRNLIRYAADGTEVEVPVEHTEWFDRVEERGYHNRPSIHLPFWACRLRHEATADARLERLQDISEASAIAEGLPVRMGDGTGPGPGFKWNGPGYHDTVSFGNYGPTYHTNWRGGETCSCDEGVRLDLTPARCAYRILWDSLHPDTPWSSNPEVVVLTFRRIESHP